MARHGRSRSLDRGDESQSKDRGDESNDDRREVERAGRQASPGRPKLPEKARPNLLRSPTLSRLTGRSGGSQSKGHRDEPADDHGDRSRAGRRGGSHKKSQSHKPSEEARPNLLRSSTLSKLRSPSLGPPATLLRSGTLERLRAQPLGTPPGALLKAASSSTSTWSPKLKAATALLSAGRKKKLLHVVSRSDSHPAYKGKRVEVPDGKVPWTVEWGLYAPSEFTHHTVLQNARDKPKEVSQQWADPPNVKSLRQELDERITYSVGGAVASPMGGRIQFDEHGAPLNPEGRTGLRGRGLLGKWG